MLAKTSLKKWLRRTPALWSLYRTVLVPKNEASWIFDTEHLSWTRNPLLSSQLPPAYRGLAIFYAAQVRLSGNRPIWGGQTAFRLVRRTHAMMGGSSEACLQVAGYSVYLNLQDMRMWQVPNELIRNDMDSAIVERILAPGDSFVDVGGNHGSFSLRAARKVGATGTVTVFEPQPKLARLIRRSLSESAQCQFEVCEQACGEESRTLPIFIPDTNSGSASLRANSNGAGQTITARVDPLEKSFDWKILPGRVFLKIDVEGAEASVLRGAREFLATRQPAIFMEINPSALEQSNTGIEEIRDLLKCCGYTHFLEQTQLEGPGIPLDQLRRSQHRNVVFFVEVSPIHSSD